MRFRHAAALALVGWYLMLPPVSNKRVIPDAPLSQWINFGTFETSNACAERLGQLRQNSNQVGSVETTRILRERDGYALCIANDDPRFKDPPK